MYAYISESPTWPCPVCSNLVLIVLMWRRNWLVHYSKYLEINLISLSFPRCHVWCDLWPSHWFVINCWTEVVRGKTPICQISETIQQTVCFLRCAFNCCQRGWQHCSYCWGKNESRRRHRHLTASTVHKIHVQLETVCARTLACSINFTLNAELIEVLENNILM